MKYYLTGKILVSIRKNHIYPEKKVNCFLLGVIIVSLFSILINFFFSLDKLTNTIFLLLIIIIYLIKYRTLKFEGKEIKFLLIISFITFVILIGGKPYNPDAYLYHLPYVKILNEEKIIVGLSNLNFRFGHVSIMQYLSAINLKLFDNVNSLLIPLASIFSLILYYFFKSVIFLNKKKQYNLFFYL
ncbi:hypothetical protein [Candidatus Pelagibacter sp. HIMB1517]|uniref:hypothetical protein n=1 Tax=Candidatus Pelagibacter sp. HIMB1517 TaxID=3413341 RepID=UPI003F875233